MSSEASAASPASAQAVNGDGRKSVNVTASAAIARFIEADKKAQANQSAETLTPRSGAQPESPAAEAQPASPEAETPTQAGAPAEITEGHGEEGEEAADVLSTKSSLDQKTKDKIQRRIDKEVGRRKQLEGQLEQVQQKLAQLESTQPPPPLPQAVTEPAPLPDIKDNAHLATYKKQVEAMMDDVEALLDRSDIDRGVQYGDRIYTKDELKTAYRNMRRTLTRDIPGQEAHFAKVATFQTQRQTAIQTAQKEFPFLADRASEGWKLADVAYRAIPWLSQAVNGEYIAGALAEWQMLKAANKAKGTAPEAKPEPNPEPAKPVTQSPIRPRPPGDQAAVSAAGAVPRTAGAQTQPQKQQGAQTADSVARHLAAKDMARLAAPR